MNTAIKTAIALLCLTVGTMNAEQRIVAPVERVTFDFVQLDIKQKLITVSGKTGTPRKVHLMPRFYAAQPDFWVYQIVAEKRNGPVIQVITPYQKTISFKDMKGRRGIEIKGVRKSLRVAF